MPSLIVWLEPNNSFPHKWRSSQQPADRPTEQTNQQTTTTRRYNHNFYLLTAAGPHLRHCRRLRHRRHLQPLNHSKTHGAFSVRQTVELIASTWFYVLFWYSTFSVLIFLFRLFDYDFPVLSDLISIIFMVLFDDFYKRRELRLVCACARCINENLTVRTKESGHWSRTWAITLFTIKHTNTIESFAKLVKPTVSINLMRITATYRIRSIVRFKWFSIIVCAFFNIIHVEAHRRSWVERKQKFSKSINAFTVECWRIGFVARRAPSESCAESEQVEREFSFCDFCN